ncbi:MAG: hypothetical protein CVT62_09380 [Actinobacteria bacterium HGW-Actinobacteria-2]|nr:MAG: hypothetical protein CVT62_09380 [Actinobacteria bacterium HGW-Actinobacteria-2]
MEIDWKGIARSQRALNGGHGENNILALVTEAEVEEGLLNSLIPDEGGESPAVGGWFSGPGGWLLLIEPAEPARPSIEALAASLERAGITGTLTGAKPYGRPAWSRSIDNLPSWNALLAYKDRPRSYRRAGWSGDPDLLPRVIDYLVDWATGDSGQFVVNINLRPGFAFDPEVGKDVLRKQVETRTISSAVGYHKKRTELRGLTLSMPTFVEMSLVPARADWVSDLDQLRTAMTAVPLDQLSIAMIDHHSWAYFSATEHDEYDNFEYEGHPEIWDEYTPAPCGIQILTDKHLAHAHDLDDWNTTRLNDRLHLVQAKDLGPWYSRPLTYHDQPDPEVIAKARADFGDMLFTHATAERLGLA